MLISTATSVEEEARGATVAVLPVGSFEQHGSHLPLSTDTLIACAIAKRLAKDYNLLLLSPVTIGCSHEHARFVGTVSIRASTLYTVINDVATSLQQSGISRLAVINGHGGNYILSNVVQEANVASRQMVLYPQSSHWTEARQHARCETTNHQDMHGGEAETSILLAECSEVVGNVSDQTDVETNERRNLLTVGIDGYSETGIIGRPSVANASKGQALMDSLSAQFKDCLDLLS